MILDQVRFGKCRSIWDPRNCLFKKKVKYPTYSLYMTQNKMFQFSSLRLWKKLPTLMC